MTALLLALGFLLLVVVGVDVLWTVVAAGSGGGPLAGRFSALAWRLALAMGRTPQGPRHRLLALSGVAILVSMILLWIALAWLAWWLIFSSADGAVSVSRTGQPAAAWQRLAFTGATLLSSTSSEYAAGPGVWQLASVAAAATGVIFVTVAITYLVPVASAVADRRQLAAYVSSLGDSPAGALTTAWDGSGFGSLPQHLVSLTPMLHLAAEQHLTYPVLHYLHSARERTSPALSLAQLDDVLTLLRHGVAPGARLDGAAVEPVGRALGAFLQTVRSDLIESASEPLPPPELGRLRAAGIPTVEPEQFYAAVGEASERRLLLATLLADDGWSEEAWRRREQGRRSGAPAGG